MRYKYKAISPDGHKFNGIHVANSEADVVAMIKGNKNLVVSVERDIESEAQIEIFKSKVKKKDLAVFCRQFYTMLDAGLGIVKCLEILIAQTANKTLVNALSDVYEDVQKGFTMSEAMGKHNNVFPTILISMVEAGEVSGSLDTIMERMAVHFEKENKLESKVKGALVYPAVLMVVTVAVVIFMLVAILPTFVGMFEGSGTELPWPTRFLLDLSDSIRTFWYIYIAVIAALAAGIIMFKNTSEGRRFFDSLKLKIPVVKDTTGKIITSRFTRTMSTLMSSGIPLIQSMEVVGRVINNVPVKEKIDKGIDNIRKGVTLSRVMKDVEVFPPMVESMVRIGEESGSLDDMLYKTADFYDDEVENSLQRMTSLIEPLMIVVMAGVVGFIVIAMYLPMLGMMDTI